MSETQKNIFLNWLKSGNAKKYEPEFCVSLLDRVGQVSLEMRYSHTLLFDVTDIKQFNSLKKKIINNRKFIFTQKGEHIWFEQIGALYTKFLAWRSNNGESSLYAPDKTKKLSINWDNLLEEFNSWMDGRLSQSTCKNYYTNVRKLISENKELWDKANELKSSVDIVRNFFLRLSATIDFQENNRIAHNQYSSSLNKFIDFLSCNDSGKLLPSVELALTQVKPLRTSQEMIIKVLNEKFKNGYRLNDAIDFERFKIFYSEMHNEELELCIDQADKIIASHGIRHNGKVYIMKKGSKLKLSELLDEAQNNGFCVIFYKAFYSRNIDIFNDIGIFDETQAKELLKNYFPDLFFKSKYFLFDSMSDICIEVKRHFTKTIMSIEEIKEKLPYFMSSDIGKVLASNECFINNGDERYALIDKIYIPEKEEELIFSTVKSHIKDAGFFSVNGLPISGLRDWNPDVSDKALQTAFSIRCLRGEYEKRGSVIVQKDSDINAPMIVKNFCTNRKTFTLDDLTQLEIELRGSCHSQALFWALEVSVRIDADNFVNDSEISFDVEKIDLALERLCTNSYITLKGIKNIYELPYLQAYHWNLYLLKSYVKRFSKTFEYMDLATNSANCGAIVRRSAKYENYIQIMASALIKEGFTLFDKDKINRFLVKEGYIFKSSAQVDKIIFEARKFREVR